MNKNFENYGKFFYNNDRFNFFFEIKVNAKENNQFLDLEKRNQSFRFTQIKAIPEKWKKDKTFWIESMK
jgi:hypothetical protein